MIAGALVAPGGGIDRLGAQEQRRCLRVSPQRGKPDGCLERRAPGFRCRHFRFQTLPGLLGFRGRRSECIHRLLDLPPLLQQQGDFPMVAEMAQTSQQLLRVAAAAEQAGGLHVLSETKPQVSGAIELPCTLPGAGSLPAHAGPLEKLGRLPVLSGGEGGPCKSVESPGAAPERVRPGALTQFFPGERGLRVPAAGLGQVRAAGPRPPQVPRRTPRALRPLPLARVFPAGSGERGFTPALVERRRRRVLAVGLEGVRVGKLKLCLRAGIAIAFPRRRVAFPLEEVVALRFPFGGRRRGLPQLGKPVQLTGPEDQWRDPRRVPHRGGLLPIPHQQGASRARHRDVQQRQLIAHVRQALLFGPISRRNCAPDRLGALVGGKTPQEHGVELEPLGLGDCEHQLRAKALPQPLGLVSPACQDDLARPPLGQPGQERFLGCVLQDHRRPAAELPLLAHLGVRKADQRGLQVQQRIGQPHNRTDTSKIEAEAPNLGHRQAPLAETVLHLFPAEARRVDDLPGISREHNGPWVSRKAEQQGDLHVGEVLHLVADHEVPCSRAGRRLKSSQGCPGKVDLVPSTGAFQALLVEDGHGVQRGAVVAEVGSALTAKGEVIVKRKKGPGEVRGVFRDKLGNRLQRGPDGRGFLIAWLREQAKELVPVLEQGSSLQRRLRLAANPQVPEPGHVFDHLPPLGNRSGSAGESLDQEGAPPWIKGHRGSLDDGANFLPRQLGIDAVPVTVVMQDTGKLAKPHFGFRLEAGLRATGGLQCDLPEQRKTRRLGRIGLDPLLHEPRVDPLGHSLQERVVREKKPAAPVTGSTQEVVDRQGRLAASRRP